MNTTTTTKAPSPKRPRKFAREPRGECDDVSTSIAPSAGDGTANQPQTKPESKAGLLLQMLKRQEGATLDQMAQATDWLPHTTRAALTGLKKKGYEVTSIKADGVRTYRVTQPRSTLNDAPTVDGVAPV